MHLAGPSKLDMTKQRLLGYKKALEDAGLEVNDELIVYDNLSNDKEIQKTVFRLLKEHNPDGLFAFTDMAALSAIKAAHKYGKNIPVDFRCSWVQ